MLELVVQPAFWYAFLQGGVLVTFVVTGVRAWKHSRARFVELVSAYIFGLLLEQGDIFLFGTYRYNENWILLGDVPIAIAVTWALVITGAMNITDALGIRGLPAPVADAVWAISLDLALDAVAIRLGLWTWTVRADEGWFGVPWGNFFAWLMVAFWFSFFTRRVRVHYETRNASRIGSPNARQWFVPFLAFGGLLATLVPFVALENTAALPFVSDEVSSYHNQVWVVFAVTLAIFAGVTLRALKQARTPREPVDHWLLGVRLVIHLLFLAALVVTGICIAAPVLLVVALGMLAVEAVFLWHWRNDLWNVLRSLMLLRRQNTLARNSITD